VVMYLYVSTGGRCSLVLRLSIRLSVEQHLNRRDPLCVTTYPW